MKTMEGARSRAIANSCDTSFSDSPSHLETRSEEDTQKKVDSASVATALARYDLPVPGGPYSRMPLHGFRLPTRAARRARRAPGGAPARGGGGRRGAARLARAPRGLARPCWRPRHAPSPGGMHVLLAQALPYLTA